jgi:hypothetical protein
MLRQLQVGLIRAPSVEYAAPATRCVVLSANSAPPARTIAARTAAKKTRMTTSQNCDSQKLWSVKT